MAEGPLPAVRLECWWSPTYEKGNPRALLVRRAGGRVGFHDGKRAVRFSVRLCRFTFSTHRTRYWTYGLFALRSSPANARIKLRGQGPRGYGSAARRLPALTNNPTCSRRDAAPVMFGQGASAPSRSRAATA